MPFVHLSHLLTNGHVCALLLASEEVDSWVKKKKKEKGKSKSLLYGESFSCFVIWDEKRRTAKDTRYKFGTFQIKFVVLMCKMSILIQN